MAVYVAFWSNGIIRSRIHSWPYAVDRDIEPVEEVKSLKQLVDEEALRYKQQVPSHICRHRALSTFN